MPQLSSLRDRRTRARGDNRPGRKQGDRRDHHCHRSGRFTSDPAAATTIEQIIADEQRHHDASLDRFDRKSLLYRGIRTAVAGSTELVIWLGMKL
jgi:hypothetical protein